MSASSRPAAPRRFRYSPLIAALAWALPGAAWAVPTDIPVSTEAQFVAALGQVAGPTTCDPNGSRIIATGPFTVSAATALPTIGCPNVEIAGNNRITIADASYSGLPCGLNAAPSAGLTKVSGVTVQGFDASMAAGMCGKLDASGNTVSGNYFGFSLDGGANIVGNTVSGNLQAGIFDVGTGSTVAQNTINANAGYGIYAGSAVVVDGNTITNNTYSGIFGLDSVTVTDNTITGNGWTGVDVFDDATITGNLIANNGSGIDAGAGAVIKGNTVRDHMGEGTGIDLFDGGTIGGPGAGEGNVIYNNSVDIYAYTGTSYGGTLDIVNNLVGTPDGVLPGSSNYGINVQYQAAAYNISGNVISGHTRGPGLRIDNASAAGTVSGNMVGVNASGTAAMANQGAGIELYNLSAGVTLSGNVISGNTGSGIDIWRSSQLTFTANRIGTNAAGNAAIANGFGGVVANCAAALSFSGNVISANGMYGGSFSGVSGSSLAGNFIGTAADGLSPLPNAGHGISLNSSACGPAASVVDREPKGAKIAAGNVLDGNVIAHNNGDGVYLWGGMGNIIRGGSIHSNAGKNINLDFAGGPLPNDSLDADTGPNMRQNHPVIDSVIQGGTETVVRYRLASTPSGPTTTPAFDLDFYANAAGGVPAGQMFLGRVTSVATDASGNAAGTIAFAGAHEYVTATASGIDGTSEFSLPVAAIAAQIAPTSLAFNDVVAGASSPTATVTITSRGHAPYLISSLVTAATPPACPGSGISLCTSGDFSCSTTCAVGTPYGYNAACTITGSFHPMLPGPASTTIYLCDNTSPTARAIPLSGNGIPITLSVSPASYNFGNIGLGGRALSSPIVIGNPTAATATLLSSVASGPFTIESSSCGSTLPPGASCSFTMAYQPTAAATQTGALTVSVGNHGNPVVVPLSGTGQTMIGQLSLPSTIDLGTAVLFSDPLQRSLELRNGGNSNVEFVLIAATPPFVVSHDCPPRLAPGAACVANITFRPLVYGLSVGQLTVSSNAEGGDKTVTLVAGVPDVPYAFRPPEAAFGPVHTGTRSPPRTFVLANNGDNAVPLSGISVSAPFTVVTNSCGASLGGRSSCTVEVAFEPVQAGGAAGWLTAEIGLAGAPPAAAMLSGTGIQQPELVLPGSIDFGSVVLGSVPAITQTLQLRNTGNALLTFTASAAGPFALSGDCQGTLPAAGACDLVITFTPTAAGEFRGALAIVSNAPGGSRSIDLAVRVRPRVAPFLQISPTFIGFGERVVGTLGATQRITITNDGGSDAVLGPVTASLDFVIRSHCGELLAPAASCAMDVAMRPVGFGLRSGQLQFTSNATESPHVVELQGTGCRPFTMFSSRSGLRANCAP